MSDPKLERSIREHYESQRLPADKLDALRQAAKGAESSPAGPTAARRWIWAAGAAALLLLGLGLGFGLRGSQESTPDVVASIAQELARGHQKDLDAEFRVARFEDVRAQMPKLDFQVAAPQDREAAALTLVGSRYCSLRQHIAASMEFRDDSGRRHTLYQVAHRDVFDSATGKAVTRDGLRIRFWREGNVFMGLASPQ